MKFEDAVKIVHHSKEKVYSNDKFEAWWKSIDKDQSYIDECVQKQQQEEEEKQGEEDGESIRSNI